MGASRGLIAAPALRSAALAVYFRRMSERVMGVSEAAAAAASERALRHDLLLAGLAQYLDVDVVMYFDANEEYLPMAEWTGPMRWAVKEVRRDPKTNRITRLMLHDRMAVQVVLAKIAGLGGKETDAGRARLDSLLEATSGNPVPEPLRVYAGGRAAKREANRAAWDADPRNANNRKRGGSDG